MKRLLGEFLLRVYVVWHKARRGEGFYVALELRAAGDGWWPNAAYHHISLAYSCLASKRKMRKAVNVMRFETPPFVRAQFVPYEGGWGILVCPFCDLFRLCWTLQACLATELECWIDLDSEYHSSNILV